MTWIETTIFITLLVTLLYSIYLAAKFKVQRDKLYIIANNINNELLVKSNSLASLEKQIEQLNLKESDGFVKFLSQSRDWAFEYIEDVQKALAEFDNEVQPCFEWARTYGMVLHGEGSHSKVIQEISVAYDKLKSLLPENTETPNN